MKSIKTILVLLIVIGLNSCSKQVHDFPRFDGIYVSESFEPKKDQPKQSVVRFFQDSQVVETYIQPDQDHEAIYKALSGDNSLDIPRTSYVQKRGRVEFEYSFDEGAVGYICKPEDEGGMTIIIKSNITDQQIERSYQFHQVK